MRLTHPALRATGIAALLASALTGTAALAPAAPATAAVHPGAAVPPVIRAARAALASGPAASAGQAVAQRPGTAGFLLGVAAADAHSAWAVGATAPHNPFGRHSSVLIMHWNGATWKRATTPKFPEASSLFGVAALSPHNAWAVGQTGGEFAGDIAGKALILHWNGRSWRQMRVPAAVGHAGLDAVAAVSPSDVWAVGEAVLGPPVILHWNGAAWRRVTAPAGGGGLFAAAAAGAHDVWAVGVPGVG
jgi:hypothetical protein